MVLYVGRHELARERRRTPGFRSSSVDLKAALATGRRRHFLSAAVIACTALSAVGAGQSPQPAVPDTPVVPVAEEAASFRVEIVPVPLAPEVPSVQDGTVECCRCRPQIRSAIPSGLTVGRAATSVACACGHQAI